MNFVQTEITLNQKPRGFHLITDEILKALPQLKNIKTGIINIFIKHTSASLTINENADPDERSDKIFGTRMQSQHPRDRRQIKHRYMAGDISLRTQKSRRKEKVSYYIMGGGLLESEEY